MSCKIIITKPAENDLDEIVSYIAKKLKAPQAASSFLDKVENCYENLASNPLMYEECRNERLKAKKYRKAVINNYIMIYRYNEDESTVYILRFIYGRRDYVSII